MRYITIATTDLSGMHDAINRRAAEGYKLHTFTTSVLGLWR